jgi:beta-lactamase superfamily II metal-dependent hydrolase
MQINIKILNIGDGDAIIISLIRNGESLLLLVDGGHVSDTGLVISELKIIAQKLNKGGPDYILCTHYDGDHIGGLFGVISYFRTSIKHVFIHRTQAILSIPNKLKLYSEESSILPSESDTIIRSDECFMEKQIPNNELNFLIQSINQEIELLKLIDNYGILNSEPIESNEPIKSWPEIKFLGPTLSYYKALFPKGFGIDNLITKEPISIMATSDNFDIEDQSPCQRLESIPKSNVTNPNLNSAILGIYLGDKLFLFSGDAGIPSFENIPDYQIKLNNIFFLKVPHHGSKNNINCNLIKLMAPKYSAISGNKYISREVVGCLKDSGSEVYITKDLNDHISFSF